MHHDTLGQTTIDFAIAMGVFLIAVAFVFTFIPSLTTPFVEGNQDTSVTADRVAGHLSEGALGDPADPFVLNATCTTEFFDGNQPPTYCGFSGTTLEEHVGVDGDRLHVNVTIEQIDPDAPTNNRFRTVCTDGSGTVIHEDNATGTSCSVRFEVGDTATDQDSVVVARRIVTIPGCEFGTSVESCDTTLKVKVW